MKEDIGFPLSSTEAKLLRDPARPGKGGQAGRAESPSLLHPEQLHAYVFCLFGIPSNCI